MVQADPAVVVDDSPSVAGVVDPRVAPSVEEIPTVITVQVGVEAAAADAVPSAPDPSVQVDHLDSHAVSRCDRNSLGAQVIQYRDEMCRPLVAQAVRAPRRVQAFSVRSARRVLVHRWDPEVPQRQGVLLHLLQVQGLVARHRCHPRHHARPPCRPRRRVRHQRRRLHRHPLQQRIQVAVAMQGRPVLQRRPQDDLHLGRPRFGALIPAETRSRRRTERACTAARGCAGMPDLREDPFDLLGVERSWFVDVTRIRALQARLLAAHHPDRHPSGVAHDDAVAQSARINRAVMILCDPLQRAEALIELGAGTGGAAALPQDVLLEMLSRRDALTEASTPEAVAQCREWIASERLAQEHAIGVVLSSASVDWSAARQSLAHLRALTRLDEDAQRQLAQQRRMQG